MEALGALRQQVADIDRRTTANHDAVALVRGTVSNHDVKIAVISADLEDIHDDLKEIKGQLKWVLRGVWTATATLLGTAVLALLTSGGHP